MEANQTVILAAYRWVKEQPVEQVPSAPLQFGGGGGTYNGMDVVDAKIAAAEARTDTKFVQVLARLDAIESETKGTKSTIIVTAIAAVGVAIAVMAFGATQFGNGVMLTTAAVEDAATAKRVAEQNALQVQDLRKDIQVMIQAFQETQGAQQP